ncbi:hypothetical protein [aff. Roholtiella sp. LEGE 12411]|uniref:hypothetical protein n=1 Tax=aff. Roholtiella sp. LEGE 12411 TaxID=1828822 RepID=UPI0018824E41|nr:hypothetical protein [aff. Roholtiella sp. LEGE 12411]MBE9036343.1 hypothetical protein [aff. Roholtiella sp. LEGE 12411]
MRGKVNWLEIGSGDRTRRRLINVQPICMWNELRNQPILQQAILPSAQAFSL